MFLSPVSGQCPFPPLALTDCPRLLQSSLLPTAAGDISWGTQLSHYRLQVKAELSFVFIADMQDNAFKQNNEANKMQDIAKLSKD